MVVNRSKPFYKGSLDDLRNKVMNPTDEIGIFFLVGFPKVKPGQAQYATETEEAVCLYTWITDSMGPSYVDNGYSQVRAANAGWWVLQMRSPSSRWGVGEGMQSVRAIALQQQVSQSGGGGSVDWADITGKPAILDDGQIGWDELTGVPVVWNVSQIPDLPTSKIINLQTELDGKLDNTYLPSWNELSNIPTQWATTQIPDLDASKITSGTLDSSLIPTNLDKSALNLRPTDATSSFFRLWPDDGTNTDSLRAELSFNFNTKQFQFRFNSATSPALQFIQADYDGLWARFGDDFDEIQFNGNYSSFSSTEEPINSSNGAVRISGIGMGNGVIFADKAIHVPVIEVSTPASLPTANGSIYYDDITHEFVGILDGTSLSLLTAVDWSDISNKPDFDALYKPLSYLPDWGEVQNIPAVWNVSQVPDLPISKIINLQTELDGKLGNTYLPSWNDLIDIPTQWTTAQIPNLDAAKITTGTFTTAQIPSLAASKITTGTFATARIPSLDASKITTGIFSVSLIPDLSISKITDLPVQKESFTPIFYGSVQSNWSVTTNSANGLFYRVGDLITFSLYVNVAVTSGTCTSLRLGGLPVNTSASGNPTFYVTEVVSVPLNANEVFLSYSPVNANYVILTIKDLTTNVRQSITDLSTWTGSNKAVYIAGSYIA